MEIANHCRCCGTPMDRSDHCPECFCEEFEETCARGINFDRDTGEKVTR